MKRILILLFSFSLITGCGQKKEEVRVNKTEEPKKENLTEQKETSKEETKEKSEDETTEENNTSIGRKNTTQTVNIKSSEAASKIGSSAVVTGYVADVTVREKVAYLNFDGKYPKNTFTAVVFADKFDYFGDLMIYKNKTVEVKGKIGQYSGKPQIILNNKSQIKVIN
jgi:hypothetical protein